MPEAEVKTVGELLSTLEGVANLEDQLYVRIRAGGTVLEQEAQNRELRLLRDRRLQLRWKAEMESDARLAAALEEMNKRQGSKNGNAIRRDVAPAPPPARSKGTLQ
ncbi:hypothetical protein [Microbacterium sp.]|uniref:hypothetical protein n=1 Tax=Microbacterium sp. TaxID=51671 RepID=UPI002E2F28B4|nr:hypothetical protein [Microbacterium sp.]HEX5728469.1 hypothetical protein [Microbacterium sp.]